MLLPYLLAFCRIVIGLVFAVAFASKAASTDLFTRAITRFGILPKRFSRPAALLFLGGELAVVLLLVAGGQFLAPGFALAALLLLVFCLALVWALAREIDTPCNCFGPTNKLVSASDVWRNVGFALCALAGWVAQAASEWRQHLLGWAEWGLIGLAAVAFVLVWTQIGEIEKLLRQR